MAVRLVIKDEVNIKLENLPLDARKKLAATFKYEIPYAKYHPSFKLGRWDGMVSLFGIGGNGYLSQLEKILTILEGMGIDIEEVDDRRNSINLHFNKVTETYWADQGKVWPPGHPAEGTPIMLRDYQVDAINRFLENPQSLQEIATGAGKCQPYSSKVLTNFGWKTMGELQVGDYVITPTGKPAKILDTYEPGIKDVYELTFSDGRSTRSCGDHIWRIYNIDWKRSSTGPYRNISTNELIKLKSSSKRNIGVPLVTMEDDNVDIMLPMDPWLLGFLLGDGSFRNNKVSFTSADQELIDKVSSKLDVNYKVNHISRYDYSITFATNEILQDSKSNYLKNKDRNSNDNITDVNSSFHKYVHILKELNLMETYSHSKFIPEIYFTASLEQRFELIRGLVDSDGTIDKSSVTFTSTSLELAKGFQQLIRSVGGIAKMKHKTNRTYMYNGTRKSCKDAYLVTTKFPKPWILASLTRKVTATNFKYQYGNTLKLNVADIKQVSTECVKCILIDSPDHLYITDDYIVTHNTITTATLSQLCEQYGRTIIIVPNKSLVEQTEEDFINCGLDVGVYYGDRKDLYKTHTICTWQSLNILDKKSKNNQHDIITLAEFLDDVKAVIVDEVHMAKAEVLKNLLTQNLCNAPIRWGLTGTVPKESHEFESIFASIGPVVGGIKAHELQEMGVLSGCHVNITQLYDLAAFQSYSEELTYLVTDSKRMTFISNMISSIAETGNTLVLVNRIDTGNFIVNKIPDSVFISGKVKSKDRKDEYDEIRTSDNKIIVATYGVAAVGLNIPRVFNLVLLEPGKSFTRVIQSIGRGVRKAKDKDFVQIWDITSTCKFAKRHLTERKKFYREAQYPFTIEKVDWQK
jgi:hypothetical protein